MEHLYSIKINFNRTIGINYSINYQQLREICFQSFEFQKYRQDFYFNFFNEKESILIDKEENFNDWIKSQNKYKYELSIIPFSVVKKNILTINNEISSIEPENELSMELKRKNQELNNIKNSKDNAIRDISQLENDLKQIMQKVNTNLKTLDEQNIEINKNKRKLEEQNSSLKKVEDVLNKIKIDLNEKKKMKKQFEEELNKLKKDINDLNKENNKLRLLYKEEKEKYENIKKLNIIINKEKEYDKEINEMKKEKEEKLKEGIILMMKKIEEKMIDKLKKEYEKKNEEYLNKLKEREKERERIYEDIKKFLEENKNSKKELETIILSNKYNHGIKCNECEKDIIGIRYQCVECEEYNLCEKCELKNYINKKHLHLFYKIRNIRKKNIINLDESNNI